MPGADGLTSVGTFYFVREVYILELSNAYKSISDALDFMGDHPETVTDKDRGILMSLYHKLCKASSISDKSAWVVRWAIEKYKSKDDKVPYAVENFGQNVITNVGAQEMLKLICGQSAYPYDSSNATITVGSSSTPEDASQTGVIGPQKESANMSAGYPRVENGMMTFNAVFDADQANFQWNEMSIGNGVVAMNRKVLDEGRTKSGDVWIARCSVSIEA